MESHPVTLASPLREDEEPQRDHGGLGGQAGGADLFRVQQQRHWVARQAVARAGLVLLQVPRAEVIDELYDAIVHGSAPLHSGLWAMASLEVCLAILQSAREQREITLAHQMAVPS